MQTGRVAGSFPDTPPVAGALVMRARGAILPWVGPPVEITAGPQRIGGQPAPGRRADDIVGVPLPGGGNGDEQEAGAALRNDLPEPGEQPTWYRSEMA